MTTPLADIIKGMIRDGGPMDVGTYMALCLGHPQYGYYMTRDRFGKDGDFITAPEISQMFGEMLAIFLIDSWHRRGRAARVSIAECGPGRGTLMADMLRVARREGEFWQSVQGVHLVETSPALRDIQRATLAGAAGDKPVVFHDSIDILPADTDLLLVGNEFLDALPIRQLMFQDGRWWEKVVGLDAEGDKLAWGLVPTDIAPDRPAVEGDVVELHPAADHVWQRLCARIKAGGGCALMVDYGYGGEGQAAYPTGDTFQALRRHEPCGVFDAPGESDLTAHVNFDRLAAMGRDAGLAGIGPVTQGAFLNMLGIEMRAQRLMQANTAEADAIKAALDRLTDAGQMGSLFKALAVESAPV